MLSISFSLIVILVQVLALSQKQCQGRDARDGNELKSDIRRQRQDLRAEQAEGKQCWRSESKLLMWKTGESAKDNVQGTF